MKPPGKNTAARARIRLSVPMLIVLPVLFVSVLVIYSIPALTEAKRTSGNLSFTDGAGSLINGAIEISMTGAPPGGRSNVNSITWRNAPNAWIYFDALGTKSISLNLRISGDSPNGRVSLEDYGTDVPGGVDQPAPGIPVKYVELSSTKVSFAEGDVSIHYTDAELKGLDEKSLVTYSYYGGAWNELPSKVDPAKNIVTATVDSLSVFAVSTQVPNEIEVRDTRNKPVISRIKTYDELRNLKKEAIASALETANVTGIGELEVDALESKNVAVRLKLKAVNKGEVVLDDFGKKNPVSVPLPGRVVKYVEIGAKNISFSSASITVRYTDAELNGGNENGLTIYHWNGASWDAVPTIIDITNKTLRATLTSLSPVGVATNIIYYFENNATVQSVGADGNTNYSPSTTVITIIPYKNLLKNGTMGTAANIRYTISAGQVGVPVEIFRFYLPFNYTNNTVISANAAYKITWRTASSLTDIVNVSLIVYNPATGAKTVIGSAQNTTNGPVNTYDPYYNIFNNPQYTIPAGSRLMVRINTTATVAETKRLQFNDAASSYINVTETDLGGGGTYNISGYVMNASSGLPLSGATVQTNTSLSMTTNATGFYNFTGLSNQTYIVNATLMGYTTNSINVTINGGDNNTANISLSPVPTYKLSGYVTNASNGAAISGANVTTNTSQTTTTNATGYYNFTLSNGTYLITASKANYSDNSTTLTINGAAVNNANILLSPVASINGGKILVVTDRYVILDDPTTGTLGTGFSNMASGDSWGTNNFFGNTTRITMWAMVLDIDGRPVNNTNVNFTLKNPGNNVDYTINKSTDSKGLVNLTRDLNAKLYYGKWVVYANATEFNLNGTYSFIYNWWGCANSANCGGHGAETVATGAQINSPFTEGHDAAVGARAQHQNTNACTWCHQSYDGNGTTTGYMNTQDRHKSLRCDNSGCHGTIAQHNTNMITKSCYNSTCHNRTDMTMKSTMNGVISAYANSSDKTGLYDDFHTPNSTVPCIVCHGPMHNITKPDETQRFIKNNNTEDTHCTYCHQSYNQHNSTVNCTLCHSDDVHDIQVFARNATGGAYYMNVTHLANPPSNCTLCHQNGMSFFNSLENNVSAGNYTKRRDPPQVAAPLEHSNNNSAGTRWNQTPGYWTNSLQVTWCLYCHGSTTHSTTALGRPAGFDGNNIVNSSISLTSSWCSSCHWEGYTNGSDTYGSTISTFQEASLLVPPEITRNATYGADESKPEYFNHTNISIKSDNSCYGCHRNGTSAVSITDFMHNLTDVSTRVSGPDCIGCHDYNKTDADALHRINNTDMKAGVHARLNSNATNPWGVSNDNKKCWGCHSSNGTGPSNYYLTYYDMGDRFANPYQCYDCHGNLTVWEYINVSSAPKVFQHFKNASNVTAASAASDNSSSCVVCHNLPELKVSYIENDTYSTGLSNASHYTTNRTELRNWNSNTTANCSYCHQNSSTAFAVAMIDPVNNRNITNHSTVYNSTNPTCYVSQCHNTGWIHNITLAKPDANSTFCLNCHGKNTTSGLINYTGAVTSIKELHNNSLSCTECHMNNSKDVHPVKYLRQDTTYSTINTSAATCITCHQTSSVDSKLTLSPPKVPMPLHHSDNASNGTIWNSTAYWTPASPLTLCTYCHNDTKHNATALGRPAGWQGNNVVNSSFGTGTWCASCHYKNYTSGAKNYSDMTRVFTSANLPVPPEITNGSYAIKIFNRSNYYNHSLKDYTDAVCRLCHGVNLSSTSTVSEPMHNVTTVNTCTGCHYSFEAMNNTTRPDRYVDSGMYNTSLHRSLSCTNCHTQGHRNIGARKACEDCHAVQANPITDKDRHNITPMPSTYSVGGNNVVGITDCTVCHDSALYNKSIGTYGYWKPKDCDYCHTYPDKYYD